MKKGIAICGGILMFVLALGITLYPLISSWYNDRHQSQIHTQYMEIVEQADDSDLVEALSAANLYNAAIVPGTQHSDAFSQEAILSAARDYDRQLNLTGDGIMGYIEIPLIRVNLPIYHGTDSDTLDAGVGHLLGTSLPVGGTSTHTVLTAHSGVATQKLFSDLNQLVLGDVFYLNVLGEALAYQVDAINVVLPHDTTYLGITEGEDYCTLVTCTPFGVNTHRLLVRGTRIPCEEAEEIEESQTDIQQPQVSTWERQYLIGILVGLGVVLVAGLITAWIVYRRNLEYEDEWSDEYEDL